MISKKTPLLKKLCQDFPEFSKDRLLAYVVCRNVLANGELVTDPKAKIDEDSDISFTFDRYVSRGGLKLEAALSAFDVSVKGLVVLDAGASTGGFTDCLLQHEARLVHSVDVGYNQLDWKLRADNRVLVHEKTNIMAVEALDPVPDAAVCDLSFRSIKGAASHILSLCNDTFLLGLIKPQFEVPRWEKDFTGVIHDPSLLQETMLHVWENLQEDEVDIVKMISSPIKGRKGNVEFMALLKKGSGQDHRDFLSLYESCL